MALYCLARRINTHSFIRLKKKKFGEDPTNHLKSLMTKQIMPLMKASSLTKKKKKKKKKKLRGIFLGDRPRNLIETILSRTGEEDRIISSKLFNRSKIFFEF
jgi:CO dehydrogenase/acetyl-CoA synthase alpha subunit